MAKLEKLGVYVVMLLMLSAAAVFVLAGSASADRGASLPPCTAAPTISASVTSKAYMATLTGRATGGAGCIMNYVQIQWGDGGMSYLPGNGTGSDLNITAYYNYSAPGQYNIQVGAHESGGLSANLPLQVNIHGPPYGVYVTFDKVYHLPGDTAVLYIQVFNTTTGALQAGVTSLFITTYYTSTSPTGGTTFTPPPTHPTPSNLSSIPFTVPPDAQPGSAVMVSVEVNATLPTGTFSENGTGTLSVASPDLPNVCVSTTNNPSVCAPNSAQFTPGQNFFLSIGATLSTSAGTQPWPGASVLVTFYLNGQQVHPNGGNFPAQITTNSLGYASAVVETLGIGSGNLNITAAVSDPNNAAINSVHTTIFVTLKPTPATQVVVTVGSDEYFSGDTLTSSFVLTTYSGSPLSGWSASEYDIVGYYASSTTCPSTASPPQVLALGTLTGTKGNLANYVIPSSYQGVIAVGVLANNATQSAVGYACTLVSQPQLLVQPSETTYHPGDTISVAITPEGSVFSTASYFAEVSGSGTSGNVVVLYNQSLSTATSFTFTVPATGALTAYTLSVVAQNSTGIIAGQDITLTEYSGYSLQVSVSTSSQYSDGSYKPGQSVSFSYTVSSLGLATPPKFFTLQAAFYNSAQGPTVVQETSPQGTFTLTVPASTGSGLVLVYFLATIPTPTGTSGVATLVGIQVQSNPSVLNYEIGAGSGFTVSDLLVILILVVAALLLFVVWRHRHRNPEMGRPKTSLFHRKGAGVEQWGQAPPPDQSQTPPGGEPGTDPQYPPYQGGGEQQPPMPMHDGGGDGHPPLPPQ